MANWIPKEIAILAKGCGFRTASDETMRRGGFAASDTCQKHATSAVRDPLHRDNIYWRCPEHEGMWDQDTPAAITRTTWELVAS